MWGTIVMGFSGFIMWFPAQLVNKLPDLAFGVSYIAHSYEGLLAMMAIIIWHFYNTHFNPDTFPMNPAWLTGNMRGTRWRANTRWKRLAWTRRRKRSNRGVR